MISRSLKMAVRDFLKTNFLGEWQDCDVKTTVPPGKPYGCTGPYAITIWDADNRFISNMGHYVINGCFITISCRTSNVPLETIGEFMDAPDGPNDLKDWTAAFLDKSRYLIMTHANNQVAAHYYGPSFNGLTEAPRVITATSWEMKTPDWYNESFRQTSVPMSDYQRVAGYSCTLYYGEAKVIQNSDTATG